MSEFISATCDRSGQLSDQCVRTHWYAAKEEEGLELEHTPGGWGPYGLIAARKKYSGLREFDIDICLPAILDEIRKRKNWRIAFVVVVIIMLTIEILLPNKLIDIINLMLGLAIFILGPIGFILLIFRVRGYRARCLDLEALNMLITDSEKKTAWRVSKRLAWKKAKQAGLDTVWSSDRFEELEILRENESLFVNAERGL